MPRFGSVQLKATDSIGWEVAAAADYRVDPEHIFCASELACTKFASTTAGNTPPLEVEGR